MKKSVLFGFLSVLLVFASCKSKESTFKHAYEKAKAQESAQVQVNAPVQVTPVATTPVASDNYDQTPVRQEQVSAVSVTGTLKAYSVVVGSFGVQANAGALQKKLSGQGYQAQVVKSPSNMYRVILSTHNDKVSAAQSRDKVRGTYPDAWLLYQK